MSLSNKSLFRCRLNLVIQRSIFVLSLATPMIPAWADAGSSSADVISIEVIRQSNSLLASAGGELTDSNRQRLEGEYERIHSLFEKGFRGYSCQLVFIRMAWYQYIRQSESLDERLKFIDDTIQYGQICSTETNNYTSASAKQLEPSYWDALVDTLQQLNRGRRILLEEKARPQPLPSARPVSASTEAEKRQRSKVTLQAAGKGLLGTGVALTGAGVVMLGLYAGLSRMPSTDCDFKGIGTPCSYTPLQISGAVSLGVGLAAAGSGAVLWHLSARK